VAVFHVLCNAVGIAVFFPVSAALARLAVVSAAYPPSQVALVHTLFNLGTSLAELPFVAAWEKLAADERWAEFWDTIKDCIRCYACRDACPLCYCHVCFVDEAMPQWCGKTQDEADVATFHLLRAFHCAGRCTDCGACEAACPQGIKMRRLTSKIEKDIRGLYGYQPGMSLDEQPPLVVYRPNDPQDFIR